MSVCELCARNTEVFEAVVEGSRLNICSACGKFGKIVKKPVSYASKAVIKALDVVEVVVSDFAQRIRSAREKSGMTQRDFAHMLNEKESVVQKLEGGTFHLPLSMARKLEKLLKIKLVEVESEELVEGGKKDSGPLTIGDLLNIKK